jgi:hypothetical protein
MAGTLTISTLSDGTNSTSSTNCIKGSCKAWCNYNGVSQTILGSYNISSVTYTGTGTYTYNFTNAMPSTAYAVTISGDNQGSGGTVTMIDPTVYTTSTIATQSRNNNAAASINSQFTCIAVFI